MVYIRLSVFPVDERTNVISFHDSCQNAALCDIKYDYWHFRFTAEGKCCHVHDFQALLDHIGSVDGRVLFSTRVKIRICSVDAVDLRSLEDNVSVDFKCT